MYEVFDHLDHTAAWRAALHGTLADWDELFAGYAAGVDVPVAAFWRELSAAYPDAIVLLSTRRTVQDWWRSVSSTIVPLGDSGRFDVPEFAGLRAMFDDLESMRVGCISDATEQMAFYARHNAAVRAETPPDRLVEWQPGDGWEPICRALGLDVPDQPFPHVNSTEAFLVKNGLAAADV
jgi:hypothetical protein